MTRPVKLARYNAVKLMPLSSEAGLVNTKHSVYLFAEILLKPF